MLKPPTSAMPAYSPVQQAIVALQKIQIRGVFVYTNVLLLILLLYTAYRSPSKYVRVEGECESNWVHALTSKGVEDVICCSESGGSSQPCYSGMGLSHELTSLKGAWVFPLLALIFNYAAVMLGPRTTIYRIRVLVRRGLLYLAVMGFRTVVLYMTFNVLEKRFVRVLLGSSAAVAEAESACWYAPLRRSKKCSPHFDHSDHVVLLVSHYLALSMFEWFALSVEIPTSTWGSVKKLLLRGWLLLLTSVTVYTLYFTTAFFHTASENLLALVIAQMFVMVPLYLLSQDHFASVKWLQLKNFVLPPDDFKGL